MYSAEGNVIDYNTGAKRSIIPTQEEIERSDSLREEAWEGIEGLLKKEQFYVLISFFFGLAFFLAGALFCYYVVLPIILQFFSRIALEEIAPMVSIESYVSFCTTMLLSFGAAFELPVAVFLLSGLELLKPATLRRWHGVCILLIFIIAAIVTPPDVVSQVLLAVPMTGLLELSIAVCWLVDRHKQRKRSTSVLR